MVEKENKARFFTYREIADISWSFLKEYNRDKSIPIPIEKILEFDLRIHVVHQNLALYNIDGLASPTLVEIYVDENIFDNNYRLYRCVLAHELGHIVLHEEYLEKFQHTNTREWKKFYRDVDQKLFSLLETQAQSFAGLILVPQMHLERFFKKELQKYEGAITRFKKLSIPREIYIDILKDMIAASLAEVFEVSLSKMKIRIQKDNLMELVS